MPRTKKKLTQYVALVLDESGSMWHLTQDAKTVFNNALASIKEQALKTGVETFVSTYTFANRVRQHESVKPAVSVPSLERYNPNGGTALFDAVGDAVNHLPDHPDASYLVIVITDGGENGSMRHSSTSVKSLIQVRQKTDRWTFTFQMPPGDGRAFANSYGIPADNIREWAATKEGIKAAGTALAESLGNFYTDRTKGRTMSQSFYVETDLSKVKTKDVKSKLDDISDRFKAYTLTKDSVAKEFVESKTKKEFVVGQLYYQLFKAEKVQTNKAVLIQEKGKGAIWGGQAARDLIGLPADVEAKVVPGNHSSYDIFVQSGSINRKLPRGTKVLIDVKQTAGIARTWDWTAQPAVAK